MLTLKKFLYTPSKYYFEDVGLRNARLNYRQIDGGHLMENIIYNEPFKFRQIADDQSGETIVLF